MEHSHDTSLVVLSVIIAIFASYTALDLSNSITMSRGRARIAWLVGGSLAMGVGIWSMHFVGMLAFSLPGMAISYDVFLLVLSILVAIVASGITLKVVSGDSPTIKVFSVASLFMAAAIAGMHYIGIASMRLAAVIHWNHLLVVASILIALVASFVALQLAFRLRNDLTTRGFLFRGAGAVLMGIAISGMHYTAMAAMHFSPGPDSSLREEHLLATSGLAVSVILATIFILGIALCGSIVDRALSRRVAMTEQITQILESITDAFFNVDKDWNFTYINKNASLAFQRLTGKTPQELLGHQIWMEIPQLAGSRLDQVSHRAMRQNSTEHVEEFLPQRNIWIESHIYPYADGLSVYFRDVTARKTSERALKEAVRARDDFLSIASHELKTPLTSIKLQAQLLKRLLSGGRAATEKDKVLRLLNQTDRGVERLSRLVDDMLDISRIARGKLSLHLEEFDLCEMTTEVVERLTPLLQEAGCEITLETGEKITGLWDRYRIEQVLTNLLTNAARYGAGKPVRVAVRKEGDRGRLSVRDQGLGIAKEDQERIFQQFERAVSGNEITGFGLGLYISLRIVEMHQGTIEVESEPGKGAEFKVDLPLRPL